MILPIPDPTHITLTFLAVFLVPLLIWFVNIIRNIFQQRVSDSGIFSTWTETSNINCHQTRTLKRYYLGPYCVCKVVHWTDNLDYYEGLK